MSVVNPKPGAMLLDRSTIPRMDADDLEVVLAVARGHDQDRRDAQRTLQRGLDQGVFGLGRHLEIRLASELRGGEWTGEADGPPESGSENEMMNVRALLSHEPRLGDNPSLTAQPSLEAIVRMHFDRQFGEGQGAIVSDMYLERIRDAAAVVDEPASAPETTTSEKDGPIDPAIARAFVANLVRKAVIADRKPQTRIQIIRMIGNGVRDGSIFGENGDLCRHFSQGGLLGDQSEVLEFVSALISEGILTAYGDGYVAQSGDAPKQAPQAETARPEPEAPKPHPAASQPKPEAARTAPAFNLGTLLSDIGLDLKVGDLDIVSTVEKASRTGNAGPLMAGIAGVLLSAVAKADGKKPD